jgi:hypothetical protein
MVFWGGGLFCVRFVVTSFVSFADVSSVSFADVSSNIVAKSAWDLYGTRPFWGRTRLFISSRTVLIFVFVNLASIAKFLTLFATSAFLPREFFLPVKGFVIYSHIS